jgi:hypothetical protein
MEYLGTFKELKLAKNLRSFNKWDYKIPKQYKILE